MTHRSRTPRQTAIEAIVIVVLVLLAMSVRFVGPGTAAKGPVSQAASPTATAPADPPALELLPPDAAGEEPVPALLRFELPRNGGPARRLVVRLEPIAAGPFCALSDPNPHG